MDKGKAALAPNPCPFQSLTWLNNQPACTCKKVWAQKISFVLANWEIKSFPVAEWAWEGCGFSEEIIQSLSDVNIFMVLIINEAKGKKGMATYFLKEICSQSVTVILTN